MNTSKTLATLLTASVALGGPYSNPQFNRLTSEHSKTVKTKRKDAPKSKKAKRKGKQVSQRRNRG